MSPNASHRHLLYLCLLFGLGHAAPQSNNPGRPPAPQSEHPAPMCGKPRGTDSYFQSQYTWTDICISESPRVTFDLHCGSTSVDVRSFAQSLDQFQKYASFLDASQPDYYSKNPVGTTHCVEAPPPTRVQDTQSLPVESGQTAKRQVTGGHAGDIEPKTCTAISLQPAAADPLALTPAIIVGFLQTLGSLTGVEKPLECRFTVKQGPEQAQIASGCIAPAKGFVAQNGYKCPQSAVEIP